MVSKILHYHFSLLCFNSNLEYYYYSQYYNVKIWNYLALIIYSKQDRKHTSFREAEVFIKVFE